VGDQSANVTTLPADAPVLATTVAEPIGGSTPQHGASRGVDPRLFLVGLTICHAFNDLYGLVLPPLLPALQQEFRLSYLQLGLLSFATTAVSALGQPLVGYLADLYRRRRLVMLLGFCLYPPALLLLAAAPSYAILIAGAATIGLAASAYHPQSTTLLLDRFTRRRGWASGIHGTGNSIGFALAPLVIGPLAARIGWRGAADVMAIPAVLAAALVAASWRFVPEPAAQVARGLRAGVTRPLLVLTAVNGVQQAVVAGFVTFLPAFYASRGSGIALAGLLTAPLLAAGLISQPVGGALSDRYGRRGMLGLALVGLGISILGFSQASGALLVAFALLVGFCGSLASPIVLVYAAELAPGGRTGQAVGIAWGVGIAISSIAAPATGAAIDAFGFTAAHVTLGALALLAAAGALWLPRSTPVR
jgi:FSR family fosmidomycin resistance protein-like MFS transporter